MKTELEVTARNVLGVVLDQPIDKALIQSCKSRQDGEGLCFFPQLAFTHARNLRFTLVSAFVLASLVTRLYSSSDIKALVNKFRVGGGVGEGCV